MYAYQLKNRANLRIFFELHKEIKNFLKKSK